MNGFPTLIDCEPMRARLTEKACLRNQRMAFLAKSERWKQIDYRYMDTALTLKYFCPSCPKYDESRFYDDLCTADGCDKPVKDARLCAYHLNLEKKKIRQKENIRRRRERRQADKAKCRASVDAFLSEKRAAC
jgi:hypothetical protein